MDRLLFHHAQDLEVRHYEVDWQGIVHNVNYFLYFELGRVAFFRAMGASLDLNNINGSAKVVLVRNEIDLRAPARFDEALTVHTRIRSIRNSSFVMEGLIERRSDRAVIAENVATHVWLDPATNRPTRVPEEFRNRARTLEGPACDIQSQETLGTR
jgi:acyl-CoA thioester hydrolase